MITEIHAPVRINSHSNLSDIVKSFQAPPLKKQTPQRGVQPWEKRAWFNYHVKRMESFAKKAESPNLTLYEVKTGKTRKDRVMLALYTYFVGVAFVFFLLKG